MKVADIEFEIKRVKEIYFFVNEGAFVQDPNKRIKIEMNQTFGTAPKANLLNITFRVFLHYEDSDNVLADIHVQNVFEVQNLSNYMVESGATFPFEFLSNVVSICISHTRALLAKGLAGTAYQEAILPVTNSADVTRHFYPSAIPQQEQTQEIVFPKKKHKKIVVGKNPHSKNSY